mmetsp:Transcript_44933/g.43509  ORF Transcript_44933/g.43509 Transcript_44933/m.43509 type:complete len:173 (-) Transcript_44933:39-557(-)|eukprot:CAMPEP_0170565662 /NCGR_PEP_ID=MMETSP0211-20121228/79336_1 /TAXON_ID=311385 /ORGANISM="Pseudokeronopsis sp., Strain OXSARD2" /LENGTH=172 /DNA_ID=CAMNT_0010886605 /DNA_START=3 /DNA_END=521 /DNA_ORIENTATION=+
MEEGGKEDGGRKKKGDLEEEKGSLDEFEQFIKDTELDEEQENKEFMKFSEQDRKKHIYSAMNDLEKERFDAFRSSSFNDLKMKKLLQLATGNQIKINKEVKQILASIAKIYVGELVEEGKKIQVQEAKKAGIENEEAIVGPILPHQLMEARRRLLESGELISEQPKPLFIRK